MVANFVLETYFLYYHPSSCIDIAIWCQKNYMNIQTGMLLMMCISKGGVNINNNDPARGITRAGIVSSPNTKRP